MAKWDDEDGSDSASEGNKIAAAAAAGRRKFDDEEDEDDVLDSWDAAEDSEVEREKAKKAEEAKAKAAAQAKADKKSKAERVAARIAEKKALNEDASDSDDEEDEASRRARLLREQQEADLAHAEDLFGGDVGGVPSSRKAVIKGSTVPDPNNPDNLIDLAAMPLFDPKTKAQFEALREVVGPIIASNAKKAHYALFLVEFAKKLAGELPSDQIKKVASALTTLSNERMKEEKAQQGGKKSKAAKTKTTLAIGRGPATTVDTKNYDDEDFGDDDFM